MGGRGRDPVLVAAVNDERVRDLGPHRCIFLEISRSKSEMGLPGPKSRCPQGCILFGGSRGECTPLPFPASRDHLLPLARGFLPLPRQPPASPILLLLPPLSRLSSMLKDPCNYVGTPQKVQDKLCMLKSADEQPSPHLLPSFPSAK